MRLYVSFLIHSVIPLLLEVNVCELNGLKVLLKDKSLKVNELGNIYFLVRRVSMLCRRYSLPE